MKFVSSIRELFTRRDALFLVVAALSVTGYVLTAGIGFPLDDSWIHQVYGRNLAQNSEWAFVSGEPSAASSSPLYTVLLALGYWLNLPFVVWTHTLGLLALAAAGMIGARLAERLLPGTRAIGFIVGLALIFTWHLIWSAAAGMETMIFATFSLALIAATWNFIDLPPIFGERAEGGNYSGQIQGYAATAGVLFGVLCGLMTVTRPEGILLAGLCGLTVVISLGRENWRDVLLWCGGAAVGFAVVIAPYLLLNLNLTGGLLPNTANAKYSQLAPILRTPYLERVISMTVPILAGGQILLLPGVVYFVALVARRARTWRVLLAYLLPVVWVVALIALYSARLPAYFFHGRYTIPALPALVLIGITGLVMLARQGQSTAIGRVLTRSLVAAAVITFVYFIFFGASIYRQDVQIINEEMVAHAHWIADNMPHDELLAIHDIGAVGYFAPRPILDIAGLVTPEIIPLIGNPDGLWDYMYRHDAHYLMAFPDQVPGHNLSDERLCPVFQSDGTTSRAAGGPKMVIYRLAWGGDCSS